MRNLAIGAAALALAMVGLGSAGMAQKKDMSKYTVGDLRSGYTYATGETQAIQDDDIGNPAYVWVDRGEDIWSTVDGTAGKSCQTCHGDAAKSMASVGNTYPVYASELKKPITTEQRINQCRTKRMGAKALKHESVDMLSITIYVKNQSRGKAMAVKVGGALKPFVEKGKAFYYQRRGLLDMSCANCHEDNAGNRIRANLLTQGQSNGFPVYRFKWQGVGSIHRRFRGCNKQVRSTPYGYGSEEYVNLELYLASRGRGLPVETPAVRN